MEWIIALVKEHPELGPLALCVGALLFAFSKGYVHVGKPRRITGKTPTESGRHRAVAILDTVADEELDMPGHWQSYVDTRARSKAESLIQEKVYPLVGEQKARLDRIEPEVALLKVEARETHDSVIRLEGKVEAVRETQAETNAELKTLDATVRENGRRTHELLGTLLGKGIKP